ncbi:MAG: methyltransferase domain-containing protein [Proteobacteria bacterium]|nr:methyltransferase domain-containing protein [Pseudomonadota bacterium]
MSQPSDTTALRPHAWTFFRQWLKNPIKMASVTPSGQQLAGLMMAELPVDTRRVIELGGGTGVFTAAMLRRGIAAQDLMVVELNAELAAHLQRLFPQARVVQGDARELARLTAANGFDDGIPVDAIVSGLGFLSMPKSLQHDIMAAAFESLRPGGRFVQFTYGPTVPLHRDVVDALGLHARKSRKAWRNLPPATVYVFTRRGD